MTTALYRRYRPDTFEDVIGQEHVTGALQNALSSGRIAHAFLFSGPRGCGKTTSARILARCLNCAEGPTPTPCGKCDSCKDLAAGGPGSLDVMEIDAASNSGVDDARQLRERAEFAPSRDRYRIYILDEAHMVTSHGFNALLKLVEEPPEHVKFIFATTEPDKVISTIRSRTHHYPFRLVPPNALLPYLRKISKQENVTIDEAALPLVIRAGGGSVRDSLSVLDQLIAGSDGNVTLQEASHLLGYTDSALLDRMVEALGTNDGASAFDVVEEVVGAGHEPRRFVEDLLQRLRDMVIAALAGPKLAADILVGIPADQLTTMLEQANLWGTRLLSRRADMVEESLREMTGATAPRLQLELLVARLLVEQPSGVGLTPSVPVATHVEPVQTPPARAFSPAPKSEPDTKQTDPRPEPVTAVPDPGSKKESASNAFSGTSEPAPDLESIAPTRKPESEQVPTEDVCAVFTGPSQDEVRSKWSAILAGMGPRSGLYRSLLGATRGVDSEGDTVKFTFVEESYVQRFRNMNGEQDLGEVLSEIFAMPLKAVVGTSAEFVDETKSQSSTGEPSLKPAGEPEVQRSQAGRSKQSVSEPEPQRPSFAQSAPEVPDYADEDEPTVDEPPLTPSSIAAVQPEAFEVDEARYRGMSATDRVLNILGGQVTEELIEQPIEVPSEPVEEQSDGEPIELSEDE